MQGNIAADLTAMPVLNLLVLFGGVIILLIVGAVIIRKLGIKNIGPIKLEQRNQTTMHSMNEATKDSDDSCRRQLRHITSSMKINISNIFAAVNVCSIARVALSSAIRSSLYESIANNHFTRELMPENYEGYRERLVEMIKEEYMYLSSFAKDTSCNHESLPPWAAISKNMVVFVELWIKRISREVMLNCERKIQIYQKYQGDFEDAKDEYRLRIVKNCIQKNEEYVVTLKRRCT